MIRLLTILPVFVMILACNAPKETQKKATEPQTGIWRAELRLQEQVLPFNFEIRKDTTEPVNPLRFILINADENLLTDEYQIKEDSIVISMHIFDTEIVARFTEDKMEGIWKKNYIANYEIPFVAERNVNYRFTPSNLAPNEDLGGRWEVHFQEEDSFDLAIGEFDQTDRKIKGTFLTTTGDYRYLEGQVQGDSLMMSCFDGEHAFLFKAGMDANKQLNGIFYSGVHWNQSWTAKRNADVVLPNANELTYLKKGYSKLAFKFPNEDGQLVSLEDDQYKNKVVIVQVLGSWCPNCMDETRFLSEWYRKNKDRGIEIIGLAFERKDDFSYASSRIEKMKERFDVDYQILFAGKADKKVASEALPMLNHIMSFPTTIFIDKDGAVQNIHTGFSGPGTGKYYEQFVEEFNLMVDELVLEQSEES